MASDIRPLLKGKKFERCLWQIQRELFGAAVEKIEDQRKPEDFFEYRKSARATCGEGIHSKENKVIFLISDFRIM